MRILVTGSCGFVGSHLVDALVERGHDVIGFDNLDPQVHPWGRMPEYTRTLMDDKRIKFVNGDIRNRSAIREAVAGADAIYHLAAAVGVGQSMYDIARYFEINVQGTANLLQVILGNGWKDKPPKLIVASSMSIYGEGEYYCDHHPWAQILESDCTWPTVPVCISCKNPIDPKKTEESKRLDCRSFYAQTKLQQEQMCLLFGRTYSVPVVALRYFNIVGPRQSLSNPYTGVAAIFASRLLSGKSPVIYEDGNQSRDFVSIRDITRANLLALTSDEANGHAINVGTGQPTTVNNLALTLAALLSRPDLTPTYPGTSRSGDIRHCYADITQARRLLGYEPKMSFADTMRELVTWLRGEGAATVIDRSGQAQHELELYGLTTGITPSPSRSLGFVKNTTGRLTENASDRDD